MDTQVATTTQRPIENLDDARRELDRLGREANAEELLSFRARADAQRLFEERGQRHEQAMLFIRLRLYAEAQLGVADKSTPLDDDLVIGGQIIFRTERQRWRALAELIEREVLEQRMDEAQALDRLHVTGVLHAAARAGDRYVPREAVLRLQPQARQCEATAGEKYRAEKRRRCKQRAIAGSQFCSSHGGKPRLVEGLPVSYVRSNGADFVTWYMARRVAIAYGHDPASLPHFSRHHTPGRPHRRVAWLKRKPRPTGGRWDEVISRLYLVGDALSGVAPNMDSRYNAVYGHLYSLREEMLKFQRAEQHQR
jgi:hypothetical protein